MHQTYEVYDDNDEYLFDWVNVSKKQWEALTERFLYIDESGVEQIRNEIEWIVLFEEANQRWKLSRMSIVKKSITFMLFTGIILIGCNQQKIYPLNDNKQTDKIPVSENFVETAPTNIR